MDPRDIKQTLNHNEQYILTSASRESRKKSLTKLTLKCIIILKSIHVKDTQTTLNFSPNLMT